MKILGEEVEFDAGKRGEEADPIDRLGRRYAEGEMDDVEFERRLDALVETEDLVVDDAAAIERVMGRISSLNSPGQSETEVERE